MRLNKEFVKAEIKKIGIKKCIITSIIIGVLVLRLFFYGEVFSGNDRDLIGEKPSQNSNMIGEGEASEDTKSGELKSISTEDKNEKPEKIVVYISGEVSTPSVITIDSDKRLKDAIDMAGGMTKNADYERVNLASKLEDSQHYIIPAKGENPQPAGANPQSNGENSQMNSGKEASVGSAQSGSNQSGGKININTADASELDKIPGVGESTANKIIDYRNKSGKFNSIEDIKNVSGIGDKKFESMKDYITV